MELLKGKVHELAARVADPNFLHTDLESAFLKSMD
jgi:hypothetical protein